VSVGKKPYELWTVNFWFGAKTSKVLKNNLCPPPFFVVACFYNIIMLTE
jgi:hypothetical protein